MREIVLDIINDIATEKAARNIVPTAAMYREICARLGKEVRLALNGLCKDGTLHYNRTINSVSFEINKQYGNNK